MVSKICGLNNTSFPTGVVQLYCYFYFVRFLDEIEITESRNEYIRMEEENKVSLKIKEVSSEMKGVYKCQLTNEHGETTCEGTLTVNCKY